MSADSIVALARWLRRNINLLSGQEDVGQFCLELWNLTGHPDHPSEMGQLVKAINRTQRAFAGPCRGIVYDDDGQQTECGTFLYADIEDVETTCPRCETTCDIAENRMKAAVARDLMPEKLLLETLSTLGEHLPRHRLLDWISEGRLDARGFLHRGTVVEKPVRRGDARVYSLDRVRHLMRQEAS